MAAKRGFHANSDMATMPESGLYPERAGGSEICLKPCELRGPCMQPRNVLPLGAWPIYTEFTGIGDNFTKHDNPQRRVAAFGADAKLLEPTAGVAANTKTRPPGSVAASKALSGNIQHRKSLEIPGGILLMENIAAAAKRLKNAYQRYIEANMAYNKAIGECPGVIRDTLWMKVPKGVRSTKWKTKRIK